MEYDTENEGMIEVENYDFRPQNNLNFDTIKKIILIIAKFLSYATLICAIAMIIYLILQHIGINNINHKPASFFTNQIAQSFSQDPELKSNSQFYYFLFQWGTALVMLAIGTRVVGNINIGSILGIYSIISIYVPTIFMPMQVLGAIMAFYIALFLLINFFVYFGFVKAFGFENVSPPGFPGLKKFIFPQKY